MQEHKQRRELNLPEPYLYTEETKSVTYEDFVKGLGTSTAREAKEYFGNLNRNSIAFPYQGKDDDAAIQLAFDQSLAKKTKEWLEAYMQEHKQRRELNLPEPYLYTEETKSLTYEDFVKGLGTSTAREAKEYFGNLNRNRIALTYQRRMMMLPEIRTRKSVTYEDFVKGLGTSTAREAKEYFGNLNRNSIAFPYQGKDDDAAIQLAFDQSLAMKRKEWLGAYMQEHKQRRELNLPEPYLYTEETKSITYEDFVKGLGTSTAREAKEYFGNLNRNSIAFPYQGKDDDAAIQLAFDQSLAKKRKEWLGAYMQEHKQRRELNLPEPYLYTEETKSVTYEDFVKGLGTSTAREAQEYFGNLNRNSIAFPYQGKDDDAAIQLAFDQSLAMKRKEWLGAYMQEHKQRRELNLPEPYLYTEETKSVTYEDFVKGLGTNTAREAKEYFGNLNHNSIAFPYQGKDDDAAIQLAFDQSLAKKRKEWLGAYMQERKQRRELNLPEPYLYTEETKSVTYKDFVKKERILYSHMDNVRSIPCAIDGFKPGQRKVIYMCCKRADKSEIKVAQLAGSVAENSKYHHGEASVMSTIVNMAHGIVGSDIINLLEPVGH
ncbi:uncharacterized protein LOC144143048 [Haemaphysalis longicornis]